jgi:excisionase family DNA binding protein
LSTGVAYGKGSRMLTLDELCEWLNITQRHARKLIERDAIPYRKVGRLLRFPEAEIEEWSHPSRQPIPQQRAAPKHQPADLHSKRRSASGFILPKTLIE